MLASLGVEAILENLAGQFAFLDSYEYKAINIAANGDGVITERLDMIRTPKWYAGGAPVMGTLFVRDGKITHWTDYWDTAPPVKMTTGEDVSALVRARY